MTVRRLRRSALVDCGRLEGVRLWGRIVGGTLLVMLIASFFVPWTQSVQGDGRVVAYSPVDRPTPIRAPIDGRVEEWFVVEGQRVSAGQVIAQLRDNDPDLLARLAETRDALRSQQAALSTAVRVAQDQIQALRDARSAAVANAELQVSIARERERSQREKVIAADAKNGTAKINLKRQRGLNSDGLSSDRDLELAELAAATARAEANQARANQRAARKSVSAAESKLEEVKTKQLASIEKARSELEKLRGDADKVTASRIGADTKLSQQRQMTIAAPGNGRILSVTARQGTEYVKAGQSLALFVPETSDRAVEIWLNGNDGPLVTEGRKVRIQFEGWPAVQFSGWPSVSVGTFGGQVAFVDAAVSDSGRLRIVVVPDPDDDPWPDSNYLRQGVRARGWVLLNRVSVAFELWRQLNGFPPATEQAKFTTGDK